MVKYEEVKTNAKQFLALTGLTVEEFEKLLPSFNRVYERSHPADRTVEGKKRQRKVGGGRSSELSKAEERLLFVLIYHKSYPLQEMMALLFKMSQGRVNYWIHRLLPVLKDALNEMGLLPEREPSKFAQHERARGKSPALVIDGVDRRRQRPKNAEEQKLHYSGKKNHTALKTS